MINPIINGMLSTLELRLGLGLGDLASPQRWSPLREYRHLVVYAILQHGHALVHAGRMVDRDHTTILASRRRAEDIIYTNDPIAAYYGDIYNIVHDYLSMDNNYSPRETTDVCVDGRLIYVDY